MQKAPSKAAGKNQSSNPSSYPGSHEQYGRHRGQHRQYRHHGRHFACMALSTALALSCAGLLGCSVQGSENGGGGPESQNAASDASEADTLIADIAGMDREYTRRDNDPAYDEAEATRIQLNGATAAIESATGGDGANASFDNGAVTIGSEGTYIVSGALDDGQLVVDAANTDKIQLVLDGVDIHNEDGPAIYIKQADKCFITLAEGSVNTLTDGSDYTLEDDSDEP